MAMAMLRDGPRKVPPRIIRRACYRLEKMFDLLRDDRDFLLIEEFQDLPPDHALFSSRPRWAAPTYSAPKKRMLLAR